MFNPLLLSRYGWKPFFQQQLSLEEFESCSIARVSSVHKNHIECLNESGYLRLPLLASTPQLATGDWIVVDESEHINRRLERFSHIARKAAGSEVETQLMVVNIDTAFIVSSLNDDFSLNRIERYLALCKETDIQPVVILTKKDLCSDWQSFQEQVQGLDDQLEVQVVNALDTTSLKALQQHGDKGNTIVVLGSSGVGKSTLINSLANSELQTTGGIRESDSKGRHTTTQRHIIPLQAGGVIIDTPGMRELQVINCEEGIKQTFADIEALAEQCKFGDCQHKSEPGCAVQQAVHEGKLDARRLDNFHKLLQEEAFNTATIAEKREKDRQLSKMYRTAIVQRKLKKGG